jgi:hypothetical protein
LAAIGDRHFYFLVIVVRTFRQPRLERALEPEFRARRFSAIDRRRRWGAGQVLRHALAGTAADRLTARAPFLQHIVHALKQFATEFVDVFRHVVRLGRGLRSLHAVLVMLSLVVISDKRDWLPRGAEFFV